MQGGGAFNAQIFISRNIIDLHFLIVTSRKTSSTIVLPFKSTSLTYTPH
jgi:hypothetical protein